MKHSNLFFFGLGKFASNYFQTIENKFNKKFKIIAVISDVKDHNCPYPVYSKLSIALNKIGEPDGYIICTHPKKNYLILKQILKFDKPILIEKPICIEKDFNKLKKLFTYYPDKKVYVNHFHFFESNFIKILKNLNKDNINKIKFIDGGNGPFRNYSPFLDWGVHSLGILSYFVKDIRDIEIRKINILNNENKYKFNLLIELYDKFKKINIKILIGNNFKKKLRIIKFQSTNKIENYSTKLQSKVAPLENLLNQFHRGTNKNVFNYKYDTVDIALNSIEFFKLINSYLKNTK